MELNMGLDLPALRVKTMKNFDLWNEEKKTLDRRDVVPHAHPRELWWCSLGVNVGSEQNGTDIRYWRPVLVLSVFSAHTCLVVPLTSSSSIHQYRIPLGMIEGRYATALLTQIRVIDTKRLVKYIEYLDPEKFEEIRKIAKDML
jgi:mRNA interferase MazF